MGGVILLLVLLTITLFSCDGLASPEGLPDLKEILGSLELNGKFVGQNGNLISFSDYQNITVYGGKMENGKWINTEHTGKLLVQNNKIVSETITVSGVYVENEEDVNRNYTVKFEIALNPDDATTLLVTQTRTLPWLNEETTFTYVYIPVETTEPNFDGTWNFGENKLIIKNGNFAIVDDSQVLYSGYAWYWDEVPNNLFFRYFISDTDYVEVDGFLARSGNFYIRIYSSVDYSSEYIIITKLSDSIEIDFDVTNKYLGEYKSFDDDYVEISDTTIFINPGNHRLRLDEETTLEPQAITFDYSSGNLIFEDELVFEKDMIFNIVEFDEENEVWKSVGTSTYSGMCFLEKDGEVLRVHMNFGDIITEEGFSYYEYNWGFDAVKFKQAPVDFTGTWKLSEKIYEDNEFADAVLTINDDGSWSLMIDGTEMNTEGFTIDLESSNKDNLIDVYPLGGVITDTNNLLLSFPFKEGWRTSALFVKE